MAKQTWNKTDILDCVLSFFSIFGFRRFAGFFSSYPCLSFFYGKNFAPLFPWSTGISSSQWRLGLWHLYQTFFCYSAVVLVSVCFLYFNTHLLTLSTSHILHMSSFHYLSSNTFSAILHNTFISRLSSIIFSVEVSDRICHRITSVITDFIFSTESQHPCDIFSTLIDYL